jgi:transcriptional regulator with XRE-family HTH domain
VTQFADLVRTRRHQLNLSLAGLSAASVDPQGEANVSHGWVHRLERGHSVIPPQLPQLRALAAGLRLPLSRLQEAAALQFLGMEPQQTPSIEVATLAERLQELSPEQREALLGFVDAFTADA